MKRSALPLVCGGARLNPDVLDSELLASAREGFGEVAATIVSHDAFDGNAEAP
jgi:hypothetical protein